MNMTGYPTLDPKATGRKIRELRRERHIKVGDIAEYMGFESQQAIYKWQRGDSLPTVDNLFALSRLFGTPIDDILIGMGEDDESPPEDGEGGEAGSEFFHLLMQIW